MKHRKSLIVCVISGSVLLAVVAGFLLRNHADDGGRYDQLLSARRAEARFMRWRTTALYRFVSRVIGYDPVSHFGKKADQLESSLCKSGVLVWLTFYAPVHPRQLHVKPSLISFNPGQGIVYMPPPAHRRSGAQYVKCSFYNGEQISLLCRPQDVAFWQSAFCCIRTRPRWGALRNLVGNREEDSCRLPDGSIVDLDVCQKWLNESVAQGWMVGVTVQSDRSGHRLLVASRRKPGGEAE
jgi:hypothetical protein